MGGILYPCLKDTLVLNTKSQESLSPRTLPDVVEGTGELNNDPTKKVNVIIIVGGPGYSLDRIYPLPLHAGIR
jgi:hypothetical protein